MKNISEEVGIQNQDLPAYSAVSQPTAAPRARENKFSYP
jgi:hypothetical protein